MLQEIYEKGLVNQPLISIYLYLYLALFLFIEDWPESIFSIIDTV